MSNKVQDFIGLWKEKRSLNTLIASNITACGAEELRSELTKMDRAQRKEAENTLQDIANMLVKRIENLKEKSEKLNDEIERSKKTKNACLAYQKQGQYSPSYQEDKVENTAHKVAEIQKREELLRKNLKTTEKTKED